MWKEKYPYLEEEGKWYAGLGADVIVNETVQNSPDLATFVKQALDTASMVGSSIRIPGPDAGAEDTSEFHKKLVERVPGMYYMPGEDDADAQNALYQKLGKPSEKAGYELKAPEGATNMDENLQAKFLDWASDLNLTKKQAQGLYSSWNEYQTTTITDHKQNTVNSLAQLRAELGAAFDQKMEHVNALLDKSGAPEHMKKALANGDFDGPTVKWMTDIAAGMMGTKPIILNQGPGSEAIMTPVEARAQITEIMARKEYWEQGNPQQRGLIQKVVELQKLADPSASTEAPQRAGFSSG